MSFEWLEDHRAGRPYFQPGLDEGGASVWYETPKFSRGSIGEQPNFMRDLEFNRHEFNDGKHISPYDEGQVLVGLDGIIVQLIQGVDEESFKRVLSRTLRATTGISPDEPDTIGDWEEMMKGGLQSALETQTIVFEVHQASRALTHQLVRTRKAGFHQQSQRATWFGDKPNVRWPESIINAPESVAMRWEKATVAAWEAYKAACDAGVSYQDARFILPEGTVNYIVCEYTIREFINVFAYRGCSMFMWEHVGVMREMRRVLLEAHPFLEPYVKISCEKGQLCFRCNGSGWVYHDGVAADPSEVKKIFAELEPHARKGEVIPMPLRECWQCSGKGSNERKCTFQGWEDVSRQCDFPWAKQANRVFLPAPKYRIGDKK